MELEPRPTGPVFNLFIGRDGSAFRLYVAASSWTPGVLRDWMDEDREIYPVKAPDLTT